MRRLWWRLKWWLGKRVLKATDAESAYLLKLVADRQKQIEARNAAYEREIEKAMRRLSSQVEVVRRKGGAL